jgi:superfamily II DNA or RNA helicase
MKCTAWAWAKRVKVAKPRANGRTQVPGIPVPRRFAFNTDDLRITPPALWDEPGSLIIIKPGNIYHGEARIPKPSYNIASRVIPLLASTSSVEFHAATDTPVTALDFDFEPVSFELYDSQFISELSVPEILSEPLSLEKFSILGVTFANKHWHQISFAEEETLVQPEEGKLSQQKKAGKSVKLKKRARVQKDPGSSAPIWDLLFPILQPPIAFGRSENYLFPTPLYPYQWAGVKFLFENAHALLADDLGTGKTIMTIVALKALIQQARLQRALIICPSSALYQWKDEIEKWAPELKVSLIWGPQRDARKALWNAPTHIFITTYDSLRSDIEYDILSKDQYSFFDIVILDEAHGIKNTKSRGFHAIGKLQSRSRWALTSTPIQNKIEDLASIFEFVYPGYLTSFDLRPEQILASIQPYFLRRRKMDVLPELPPKIYAPIGLELDDDQEIAYRRAETGIREELSALGDKVTKQHIFAKLAVFEQICNFAPRKASSPKTDALLEQIEEIIAGGENGSVEAGNKIIVFSQYVDVGVGKLEKILAPYGIAKIFRGQSDDDRRREIEKFKESQEIPILLASVRSGGADLVLTEATYVAHFDHWWNPAVMRRAQAGVHPPGLTSGVNIYSYWMKDTIDDRIRQKLAEKRISFERVNDDLAEEKIEELFTIDEWLEILGVKNMKIAAGPIANAKIWRSLDLAEIREKLSEFSSSTFEGLVQELIRSLGYPNVKVTGKSHDGGMDMIATWDTKNGVERAVVQCRRQHKPVDVQAARDFLVAISNDPSIKQGFLVTTGEFTAECLQFCQGNEMISPISGIELAKYVKQFGLRA